MLDSSKGREFLALINRARSSAKRVIICFVDAEVGRLCAYSSFEEEEEEDFPPRGCPWGGTSGGSSGPVPPGGGGEWGGVWSQVPMSWGGRSGGLLCHSLFYWGGPPGGGGGVVGSRPWEKKKGFPSRVKGEGKSLASKIGLTVGWRPIKYFNSASRFTEKGRKRGGKRHLSIPPVDRRGERVVSCKRGN